MAQLLHLEGEDPDKDIALYINSPGGSVTAGLAVYDTMQYVKPDVSTIALGQAASMGAVLLTAGTKGKRHALPNSRIMIHQPLAGMEGTAEEILYLLGVLLHPDNASQPLPVVMTPSLAPFSFRYAIPASIFFSFVFLYSGYALQNTVIEVHNQILWLFSSFS